MVGLFGEGVGGDGFFQGAGFLAVTSACGFVGLN